MNSLKKPTPKNGRAPESTPSTVQDATPTTVRNTTTTTVQDNTPTESSGSQEEHESASYNVVCASPDGYELRRYEKAVWATTVVNDSTTDYFQRLYGYIAGDNDRGIQVATTKPNRKRMIRRQGGENSSRASLLSVSLYIPMDDPPLPLDETVFLENVSSFVFTSGFRESANDWSMNRQYTRLRDVLIQEGHQFVDGAFDVLCYNSLWEAVRCQNEILIEADTTMGEPSCDPEPDAEEPPNGKRQCGGFTGKLCDINIDDCGDHACQNGGACIDEVDSYTCRCPSTYRGDFCEIDVDECRNPGHCDNGATCKNTDGGFECVCSLGYSGVHCENNIDDCGDWSCLNGGTCVDGIESFSCLCPPTYEGHYCQYRSACVNSPCHSSATCETDPITQDARCICPEGRTGSDCSIDIDECDFEPCGDFGHCINIESSFMCVCVSGYTGAFCDSDIDECLSNPCVNGGTCFNLEQEYLCLCIDGYTGEMCEHDIDECESNPCQNDAACADRVNGYTCTCQNGWTGPNCDENINECASSPCGGGNTCLDGVHEFTCLCAADCLNGGTCVYIDVLDTFACRCSNIHVGNRCQYQAACVSSPCHSSTTCETDPITQDARCICPEGRTGSDCSIDIDECDNGHECPPYSEVERINDDVVIRRVEAGVYVTKVATTCNMTNAMEETYMPLREYFTGENAAGEVMPLTVPVFQRAIRSGRSDGSCNFTYETSFYLPREYHAAPPAPIDDSIVISEAEPALYYAMTFHETPTPREASRKYNELKSLVAEASRCYSPGEFSLAFYDVPSHPSPRRYEMWVPVDEHCKDIGSLLCSLGSFRCWRKRYPTNDDRTSLKVEPGETGD